MIYQKLKKIAIRLLAFLRCRLLPYSDNIVLRYLQALYRKYLEKFLLRFYPMLDKMMMLALTYKCQCKCEHCGSNLYRKEGKEELKTKEILNLIDTHSELGGMSIYFFGGEPLIINELPYYIRYAKQRGLFTRLDTNGFLLDEDMVRKLKTSGLDLIGVSIDSPYETVHDGLRKLKGIFNRALNGIKYCKKYRIVCYITTYATKENLKNGDLVRLINLAKDIGVGVRILSSICSGKWLNRYDVALSPDEITLLRSLTEKRKVFWEDIDDKEAPFSCIAFKKEFFYVSSYGDVQPCCYLPIPFGNVREESLEKIITRMYNSDTFTHPKRLYDCLANDENFVNIRRQSVES